MACRNVRMLHNLISDVMIMNESDVYVCVCGHLIG